LNGRELTHGTQQGSEFQAMTQPPKMLENPTLL